jgi:hypothetical protein
MKRMFLLGLTLAALSFLSAGCSGDEGGCGPGEGAELVLSTNPPSGEAQANGNDTIRVVALGQDDNCKPFANGTPIEFRISDQDPENPNHDPAGVGFFSNDGSTIIVTASSFGASTDVRGTVVGTAKVSAFCEAYNLTAIPIDIEFTEPAQSGQCTVELEATPPVIPADGATTSVITATLTADTGGPMPDGTTISFTTTKGKFTESNGQNYDTQTSNNTATATLQSEDSQTTVRADVTATFTCNDSKLHSNQVGVTFGESNAPAVYLRASSNEVLADNVSSVDLTAEIFLPGGARAGTGEEVNFYTELGRFQESGGPTYVAYTNDSGMATATFIGGNQGGVANVRASVFIDQMAASDSVEISVRQLGFIEYVSASYTKLGIKGSGKNESSLITFIVKDTEANPFPAGALVEFTLSGTPGNVTLDPQNDRTDSNGIVTTNLISGTVATTVTVNATAHVGTETLSATTPSIAIVGAKPDSTHFTFSCARFNVGGLVLNNVETECTVSLADRYSNKIGFAHTVNFMTEAGSIDGSAVTSETGADIGMTKVNVRTGDPRPEDVSPIAGEPFIGGRNPRDGIVTIMAYTTGEEFFDDTNANGVYDPGEPFEDIGEPFLDKNDNGIREPNETLLDINQNDVHDGPNGQWDSDTLIWKVAYMLWTGEMATGNPDTDCGLPHRYSVVCPSSFVIAKGGEQQFDWEIKDINLNPLNMTLGVNFRVDGKGSKGVSSPPLPWQAPDALGGFVDPTRYWANCDGGSCGWFTVKGALITDTTPPASGTVTLQVTYNQTPGGGVARNEVITIGGTFE